MKYSAIVLGATGLIGRHLVNDLINDQNCYEIKLISRRKTSFQHQKIKECLIDFNNPDDYLNHLNGDVLFSCFGTTLSQAGSKEKQYLVDFTYQYRAAKAARKNNVSNYILVSSPWANAQSKHYYRKMKAELEHATTQLGFKRTIFIRPNGLIGKRKQPRFGELFALKLFTLITKRISFLQHHQPIEAKKVAKAMLNSFYLNQDKTLSAFSRNEVLTLAQKNLF